MYSQKHFLKYILLLLYSIVITSSVFGQETLVQEQVRVLPRTDWEAGSKASFTVVYTIGTDGVPAGAAVGIAFKHAIKINFSNKPNEEGYVKAVCSTGAELPIRTNRGRYIYPEQGGPANSRPINARWMGKLADYHFRSPANSEPLNAIVRNAVYADVGSTPLKPGDEVHFIFGANSKGIEIPLNVCENPIRAVVDPEGDGTYTIVPSIPTFRIVARPLDHFFITIPSTSGVGDTADICIRAEDPVNNVATSFNGEVVVKGMPECDAVKVKLKDGIGHIDLPVKGNGVVRLSVTGQGMSASSNPMIINDSAEAYGVYWGDLHGHTIESDALGGTPEYYYAYARDCADLDVCAGADHGPRIKSREATHKFNEAGKFVTFWGYEWAESKPGRLDWNIYFKDVSDPIPAGWHTTIEGFWASLEELYGDNASKQVIVGPHMFTYPTTCKPWFENWDERYCRFVEIYSEHGMSEYEGNPRMLANGNIQPGFFMQDGLAAGCKFGILGSSDTHDSRAGRGSNSLRYQGGLVAFIAKDLTRESIWEAWWNRRFYAASNERIYIDFKINGHFMGEEITADGAPHISYTVYGCTKPFDVILLRNNTELKRTASVNGKVFEDFHDTTFDKSANYYIRVVEREGEYAWSSPIWVNE